MARKNKNRLSNSLFILGSAENNGFTLFEILISVSILAIITAFSFSTLAGFRLRHNLDLDSTLIVDSLRNAQNRAILGENGTDWGVKFNNSSTAGDYIEIFSGSTYSSSSVVEVENLSAGSSFTNPASDFSKIITFSELTGIPSYSDVITIKSSVGDSVYNIFVNSVGRVSKLKETGLVGYWPMDEASGTTVYDASVNSGNGTVQGSPIWQTETNCKSGTCLSFDGSTDYITATDTASIDPVNAWTLSAWVNRSTIGVQHSVIEKYDWSSGKGNYLMRITPSNKLDGYIVSGISAESCGSTATTISSGSWYFLAVTFDNSSNTITCYVNGASEASNTSVAITPASSDTALKLACRGNDCGTKLNGVLDDVRVYNRALSSTEIKSLYESY